MRVLIINNVYPSFFDPASYVFVENQALSLKKNGFCPIVLDIDLRSFRHKRRYGIFSEIYHGIKVYRYSFPLGYVHNQGMVRFLNRIIGKIAYKKIVKREGNIDLIHAHFGILSGFAALSIYEKYHIPYVITEHHSRVLNMSSNLLEKYKPIYDSANAVIAVGVGLKNKLDSIMKGECLLIPNVIDTDKFNINYSIKRDDKFLFLSIGHLIASKNHELLLRAFKQVQSDYKDVELIIIGEGMLKDYLYGIVNDLNIDNVTFIDRIENDKLPEFYNKANCFVLPSKFETFGVVYAESLCCGTPVISTKCGGPESFINKNNGYLVDIDNLDQLVNSMNDMIKNSSNFSREKIRESILKICSEKNFCDKIRKVYYEVVKNED